jgi:integrase
MRGSPKRQAKSLIAMLKKYGKSKHRAKAEARRHTEPGKKFSHSLGIHSVGTARNYQSVYVRLLEYVRQAHDIRDICDVTSAHVEEWLMKNIERNIAYDTLQTYCSALEKIPTALETIGIERESDVWSRVIQECRDAGKKVLANERKSRAYQYPHQIVEHLEGNHQVAGALQLKCGCRISEISELKIGRNLVNQNMLRLTNTKGGLVREVPVPPDLYQELLRVVNEHGIFKIDRKKYATDLKKSALKVEGKFHGSHGLRWNFVRNEMFRLEMEEGMTFESAKAHASSSIGHVRPCITNLYLLS